MDKKDAQVQKFIVTLINNIPMMHILDCKNSREISDELCGIYEKDVDQQKYSLSQEFFNFKYDKCNAMSTHLSKTENLAHRLNVLKQELTRKL